MDSIDLRLQLRSAVMNLSIFGIRLKRNKICVIGGSKEYTGAPHFSSKSALLLGIDEVNIVTTQFASIPLKVVASEATVLGMLPSQVMQSGTTKDNTDYSKLNHALKSLRVNGVLIGPGLGRDPVTQEFLSTFIENIQNYLYEPSGIVIDADAIQLVCKNPGIVYGIETCILTPNVVEFRRLCDALNIKAKSLDSEREVMYYKGKDLKSAEAGPESKLVKKVVILSKALYGKTIFLKGKNDIIVKEERVAIVTTTGSPKRSGGQGDVLAGCITALLAMTYSDEIISAVGASMITRRAASIAFSQFGRAVTASDVMRAIPRALELILLV